MHDNGLPRRTWLHVSDTANAVLKIIESEAVNEIYNISGNYEEQNINVAKKIIDKFYNCDSTYYEEFMDFSEQRQGQDIRYAINDGKLKTLGWNPIADFDTELTAIVDYYKNNFIW
jgi:dTDP-D-glucose 4,6-dehydratase